MGGACDKEAMIGAVQCAAAGRAGAYRFRVSVPDALAVLPARSVALSVTE